jgi:ABC-2 type transport system permease protein
MTHRPGVAVAYRWELRKLRAQKRTFLGLGFAAVFPLLFTLVLLLQTGAPEDALFGRYVRETGLATPLLLLLFGSGFLFPLMAALVAGDIVAAEDGNGTLKTIRTRSVDRGPIFAAKVLAAMTYAATGLLVFGVTAIVAGGLAWGLHPLTSLSGTVVQVPRGILLIAGALVVYLLPLMAIASLGLLLSTVTRNSAAAVVGSLFISLMLALVAIIPGLDVLQPYLLPTQFDAWHGLLREPTDWAPIVRAAWVCALYAAPALVAAWMVFLRRDVAGG